VSALTAISIVRGDWRHDNERTWVDLATWQRLVEATPRFRSVTHVRGADGRGNVEDQERPNSAVWSGHPTGTEYVFLWRIGRIEVGQYSDPHAGAEFALSVVDDDLRATCDAVAETLAASVEYAAW
jgi:hypothetical protein